MEPLIEGNHARHVVGMRAAFHKAAVYDVIVRIWFVEFHTRFAESQRNGDCLFEFIQLDIRACFGKPQKMEHGFFLVL